MIATHATPRTTRTMDLAGQQFGSLRVLEFAWANGTARYWRCRCVCGRHRNVRTDAVRKAGAACGCDNSQARVASWKRRADGTPPAPVERKPEKDRALPARSKARSDYWLRQAAEYLLHSDEDALFRGAYCLEFAGAERLEAAAEWLLGQARKGRNVAAAVGALRRLVRAAMAGSE